MSAKLQPKVVLILLSTLLVFGCDELKQKAEQKLEEATERTANELKKTATDQAKEMKNGVAHALEKTSGAAREATRDLDRKLERNWEKGRAAVGLADNEKASMLYGRLWSDENTTIPVAGGHVFAVSEDGKTVFGHSRTATDRGANSGAWSIAGLPPSGDVVMVGFHPDRKMYLAGAKVKLDGRAHEFNTLTIHYQTPDTVGGADLANLVARVSHEANRIGGEKANISLADYLLSTLTKR